MATGWIAIENWGSGSRLELSRKLVEAGIVDILFLYVVKKRNRQNPSKLESLAFGLAFQLSIRVSNSPWEDADSPSYWPTEIHVKAQ